MSSQVDLVIPVSYIHTSWILHDASRDMLRHRCFLPNRDTARDVPRRQSAIITVEIVAPRLTGI